jgi:hypothetical protein
MALSDACADFITALADDGAELRLTSYTQTGAVAMVVLGPVCALPKLGLWFNPDTYQYRSAHDDRLGRKFISAVDRGQAA